MLEILIILFILFYLGVESGASFPWSSKWQKGFLTSAPELLLAGVLTYLFLPNLYLTPLVFLICYLGIQSATWSFLEWKGYPTPKTDRSFTLKPIVDFIANRIFKAKLGDYSYSWISATVKGFILSIPVFGVTAPLFALGYEIGYRLKPYTKKYFNPHIMSEGLSYSLLGLGIILIKGVVL